ncbi:MAG: hypothetical protein LLF81_06235 [Porphyromonadaceae bacterium]|nr:hypothetical protein [Porphyromonadaceae bacterium]
MNSSIKVVILPEVVDYFLELASILYDKGYFGFEENAIKYARDLFKDISDNLPKMHKRIPPKYFEKYGKGMHYAIYKRNKNTSWYVFFSIYHVNNETTYLVRYVSNNHMIAKYL